MNPPFGHQGELHHVLHAMKFLKPGGVLVSILPAASRYRDDKRTLAFHKALEAGSPRWSDLPAGSFAHAGTMVNTTALTVKRAT